MSPEPMRFKSARKIKGESLREAAKGLGMSHEWLNKVEKGKIIIDNEWLLKLANYYNVKLDYFFNKTPDFTFSEIKWCKMPDYV